MTAEMNWADKIQKLLRKAEGNTTPEERDALIAKAQHLMTVYAIDEAMLDSQRVAEREQIVEVDLVYTGIFQKTLMNIGHVICNENGCRCFYTERGSRGAYDPETAQWPKQATAHVLHVVGFESDVRNVRMLDTSLQVQCLAALTAWWDGRKDDLAWLSRSHQNRERHTFIRGFTAGLTRKLREGRSAGEHEVVVTAAARTGRTEAEVSTEVGIVLRDRQDQVDDWMDRTHGRLRTVRRTYAPGAVSSRAAGDAAGYAADTGGSRVGAGTRGELGG